MDLLKINNINKAIDEWFEKNCSVDKILAKELMPFFIQKGIFIDNPKDGLPIRKILRQLDDVNELNLIPSVMPERKIKNTNWYFVRSASALHKQEKYIKSITTPQKTEKIITGISTKKSFKPIADKNSQILILGSLPGVTSLAKGEYYANSNNHFWKIMDAIFGPMPDAYSGKCKFLLQKRIALWDVIAQADREGSLDSSIINEVANDFDTFFKQCPGIITVCFNGEKAQNVYRKLVNGNNNKKFVLLPSSSNARAMRKEEKVNEWKRLICA